MSKQTSKRSCITTPDAPKPIGPYCQGNIAGPFIFTAEVGGNKPNGELPPTVEEQTDQVINNLEAILKAGYATLADVTKVTVYIADLADFAAMNGAYAKRFQQPYPVRSIIQTALPEKGAFVAMDATALRPEERQ